MANNRMWLVCPCGERFGLAKCLADNWYTPPGLTDELGPALNAWFDLHRDCEPRSCGGTLMRLDYEEPVDIAGLTRRPARSAEEVAAKWVK